jgi:hypothetical protein
MYKPTSNDGASCFWLCFIIIILISFGAIPPVTYRYLTYRPMTCLSYVDCPWSGGWVYKKGFNMGNEGSRCVNVLDDISKITFIAGYESISGVKTSIANNIPTGC